MRSCQRGSPGFFARFVGRRAELDALEAVLQSAVVGIGGAVLVHGEAGIGKSRLIAQLDARATAAGVAVLVGECLELAEGQLPFAPIVAAMRGVLGEPEHLTGLDPVLRSAVGALSPARGSTAAQPREREQLFEGVYRVLATLAKRRPVLLIVEDVHWIDPSSRDLLSFVVHNARRDRVLVVATYRSDELARGHPLRPFLAELERSGRSERLELEGLRSDDVAEQIAAITGARPRPTTVDAIFARSEGNPFFVEELLAGADPAAGTLPSSLREALLLRIERVSPFGRDVMAGAAAIGRSFDHRLLASVVSGTEETLLAALRDALEHHLLVPARDGVGYRFRHALLREAIYEDTLPGQRLRLHRVIAETLTARPELADPDIGAAAELAHHWYAARELPPALSASIRAAGEAARMYAHPEALSHLQRALDLWDDVPRAEEIAGCDRIAVLLRASEMAEHVGDDTLAIGFALRARRAVSHQTDPLRAAAAEARLGRALWYGGRADEALEHLAQVVRLVPEQPPSVERADALAAYGRLLMLNGVFRSAVAPLEAALELGERVAARTAQASAMRVWRGQADEAHRLAREAMDRVAGAESQLNYTAEIHWLVGRVEADRAEAARFRGAADAASDAVEATEAVAARLADRLADYLEGGAPPEALAFEALLRGERSRAQGRLEVGSWREAGRRFSELGQAHRAAYAEMRATEAQALAGAPARQISEPLRRVYAVAVQLGMAPLREEVEALARRTGVALGPPQRSEVAVDIGLTERELGVLALLADGRTNREIAKELFITEKTASAHVSHILTKLGVANRAAAAAAAQRLGLTHDRASAG